MGYALAEYDVYILPIVTGAVTGVIVAIVTQIIAHYFSKKTLAVQTEHSLKLARMQLYHQDRKEAIIKLDALLKAPYKSFRNFRDAVNSFLDGSTGLFLPKPLKKSLSKQLSEINSLLVIGEAEIHGEPEEEDPDEGARDYYEWIDNLSDEEKLDMAITERLSTLKSTMREKIEKYISEE